MKFVVQYGIYSGSSSLSFSTLFSLGKRRQDRSRVCAWRFFVGAIHDGSRILFRKLISARDVATQTGLSIWRVYELCREKKIPHRRLGRSVWFVAEVLGAFLAGGDSPAEVPGAPTCRASLVRGGESLGDEASTGLI